MPGRDGTGPSGVRSTSGRGRIEGVCICPKCSHKLAHKMGVPCNTIKCPKCGTLMIRG